MTPDNTKAARDIEVGDLVKFPNSRKAQPVTGTEQKMQHGRSVHVLSADNARWTVPSEAQVKVEVANG